jgi:hypothetical protein
MIAASIRTYALVARGHRLRRDGRRRKRRAGHLGSYALFAAMSARAGATVISFNWARLRRPARRRRYRREIRVLVVADPYAGIDDEPVSGSERVARAQRAVHREID